MEGWRSLTIPNSAEEQYLGFDRDDRKGWILMCLLKCTGTKKTCTEDMILKNQPKSASTTIEMQVNGLPVTGYTKPMSNPTTCTALQHEAEDPDQSIVWNPNKDGKYDIQIRITDVDQDLWSQIRISSFILM